MITLKISRSGRKPQEPAQVYWLIARLDQELPKAVSAGTMRTSPTDYEQEWIAYWYPRGPVSLEEIIDRALTEAVSSGKESVDMEFPIGIEHEYHRLGEKGTKAFYRKMREVLSAIKQEIRLNFILPKDQIFDGGFISTLVREYKEAIQEREA